MSPRADGSAKSPYSALNLRLALAIFGEITMVAVAVAAAWWWHSWWAAGAAAVVAVVAAGNIAVIQRRRIQRRTREPGVTHSLFE